MKITNFIKTHKMGVLSFLLVMIATALGADSSFAMAEVALTGADGGMSPEAPAAQEDHRGYETQHQGEGATAGAARAAGLEVEEIEPLIAKFRPYQFPTEYIIMTKMQQRKVQSYEVSHYRSGATVLEAVTGKAITSTGSFDKKNVAFTLTPDTDIASGAEAIHEYDTIYVADVMGYDTATGAAQTGGLFLFVTKADETSIKMVVINPPATGTVTIPSGTTLTVCGNACSESQMVVDPETYLPEKDTLYLQKKISNIVMTDEWIEQAKKVKFITEDIVDNGLYNHKRKAARSHWLGMQYMTQVKVKDAKIGTEPVYMERGILRQINMSYTYAGSELQWNDLIAINKMMFTDNAANTSAVALLGKNMHEKLLHLVVRETQLNKGLKFETVEEMGITIHKWRDGFGTLEFIYDPTLNDIGYSDYMVILDCENAVHYYKKIEAESKQDLKKTGEAREAERRILQTIDCVGLKGYNSIIVGPASGAAKIAALDGVSLNAISAASLPSTPADKTVVFLTADNGGFAKGTLVQYDGASKTWHEYEGVVEEILG